MDREQILYLAGRGSYSLMQFGALIVFSHLLAPSEYGLYAIGVAAAFLGNAVLFRWLRQSVLRFSGPTNPRSHAVLMHVQQRFRAMAVTVTGLGAIAGALAYLVLGLEGALLVAGTAIVVVGQGFFEIHLEFRRSTNDAVLYAGGLVAKALVLLLTGSALAFGLGSFVGPLGGVALGFLVGGFVLGGRIPSSKEMSPLEPQDQDRVRDYGVPLAVMFGFTYAMSQMDRVLLGVLDSSAATGIYAVAYDIAREAIFVPLLAVSLPYFPAVVDLYEGEIGDQVMAVLNENVGWLVALGVPAVVGISMVGEGLTRVLLDPAYAEVAASLIPFVAAGAFLLAFQEFILNTPYMLEENTRPLSAIHGIGAGFNLVANVALIPAFGVHGAAAATVVTYLLTFALKAYRTRSGLSLSVEPRLVTGTVTGTLAMVLVLVILPPASDLTSLLVAISAGLVVYLVLLYAIWRPEPPERPSAT